MGRPDRTSSWVTATRRAVTAPVVASAITPRASANASLDITVHDASTKPSLDSFCYRSICTHTSPSLLVYFHFPRGRRRAATVGHACQKRNITFLYVTIIND